MAEALECYLIEGGAVQSWRRFLERAGLIVRQVAAGEIGELGVKAPSALLFFDLRSEADSHDAIRRALAGDGAINAPLIALMPGIAGEPEPEDLDRAWDLGAADFILSDMPAATVSARLRFAARSAITGAASRALAAGATAWEWDLRQVRLRVSATLCALLGRRPQQRPFALRDLLRHVHAADRQAFIAAIKTVRERRMAVEMDIRVVTKAGGVLHLRHGISFNPLKDGGTALRGVIEVLGGEQPGSVDPITGLLSYEVLRERMEKVLAAGEQPAWGTVTGLAVFNLNRFKGVTSRFGPDKGNQILAEVARRVRRSASAASLRGMLLIWTSGGHSIPAPIVARLHGDELAVLAPGLHRRADMAPLVREILTAIEQPLHVNGASLYLTASAGIAVGPEDASHTDSLLQCAHAALSQAQQTAASSYAFYSALAARGEADKLALEHRLRQALRSGEMQMYYQPQVNIASGRIIGVEALLRWNHPDLGLVSPDQFLATARETGLTAELGRWSLLAALGEIADLEAGGLQEIRVSINVSADMFAESDLAELVLSVLDETGFSPHRLTLEMTEHTILDETAGALEVVDRLKARGVKLALDDFGTGYSALSYLKVLPIDELKIDRSFISGLDSADIALLRAIISMAKTLGMTVTAEGVETEAQRVRLMEEGCDIYQGWLCSRAVPGGAIAYLIASQCANA